MANISGPVNNPAKAAAGSNQWWIVVTPNTQGTQYQIVQGTAAAIQKRYGQYAQGPFATKADAQAAAGGQLSPGQLGNAASSGLIEGVLPSSLGAMTNPLAIFDIGHWIGVLVTDITNVDMWKALGWMVLGFALTAMGLVLWFRQTDFAKDLTSAATTAAMAA